MERHTYIRIAKIDALIRQKRYPNCRKLAELFETSQRTILRDIEAMKDSLGAPIQYSKENNGYYYGEEKFPALPKIKLTEGELVSVFLGEEILKKYRNSPFAEEIKKAFEKIELLLPEEISIDYEEIGRAYSFDIEHSRELDENSAKVFATLAKAIKTRHSVEIKYYSVARGEVTKRKLDPFHLRHTMGTWYLIALCHLRQDIRTFVVSNIREITMLEEKSVIPRGFSIDKFLADSWRIHEGQPVTKVVVRFEPPTSRWVSERKWHASQKTVENKDGSVTMSFKVAGTGEIKPWIMSFGASVRVIAPKNLMGEIREEVRRMIKL
jgi:predicted DNA-binding transcriptional regulator YafY